MADDVPNLGHTPEKGAKRDAVHIAVAPAVADLGPNKTSPLVGGEHVGFTHHSDQMRMGRWAMEKIAVVDPFRSGPVRDGEPFWAFLYPNTITSLRHNWEHPAYLSQQDGARAEAHMVIEQAAAIMDRTPEQMMSIAQEYMETGHYEHNGSNEDYYNIDWDRFWKAYDILREDRPSVRGIPFSCAC